MVEMLRDDKCRIKEVLQFARYMLEDENIRL